MNPKQVFCFACGCSHREPKPAPRKRLSPIAPVLFALVLLGIATALLMPLFSENPRHLRLAKTTFGQLLSTGSQSSLTSEQRRLLHECRCETDKLMTEVARLRQQAVPESVSIALDWAEAQLTATRRMLAVFSTITDSEALSDASRFLNERLARVRQRLSELSP